MQRFIKVVLIIFLSVIVSVPLLWWTARRWTERPRTQWKTTLDRLNSLSLTNDLIRAEIDQLKTSSTNQADPVWTGDHVLLMTNGEFIVYEYRHGQNDYFPPHLFLGHASNDQWLYSSYHFCNHMQMVRLDDPPGSIAEFCSKYFARPFDGKSDECLKLTR